MNSNEDIFTPWEWYCSYSEEQIDILRKMTFSNLGEILSSKIILGENLETEEGEPWSIENTTS